MTTRRRPPAAPPPSLRRPPRDGREGCDLVSSRVGRLGSSGWAMILGPVPGAGRLTVGGSASAGFSTSVVADASGAAGAVASGAGAAGAALASGAAVAALASGFGAAGRPPPRGAPPLGPALARAGAGGGARGLLGGAARA